MLITVFDIDTIALLMGRISTQTALKRVKNLQKLLVVDRGRARKTRRINVWLADDVLELIETWKYDKSDRYSRSSEISSQTEEDLRRPGCVAEIEDLGVVFQEQAEDVEDTVSGR